MPHRGTLRKLLSGPQRYADALTRTVHELAATRSAILVGSAGVDILRDDPQALHVRLIARRDDRLRRVCAQADLDLAGAARMVDESDRHRAVFHTALFGKDWHDPHRYHLVLNTSFLTPAQAAAVILLTIQRLRLLPVETPAVPTSPCWQHITVSREYGSGGHAFSGLLADALHWPWFDHDLLHQSAALSGIPLPALIRIDEHGPGFMERLHTLQESASYFEGLREAILRDAAASASIIVGRGGVMLLPQETTLHLRLSPPCKTVSCAPCRSTGWPRKRHRRWSKSRTRHGRPFTGIISA